MGVSVIRAATIRFPSWSWFTIACGWGSIAGATRVTIIAIIVSATTAATAATSTALVAVVSASVAVTAWGISVVAVC
jgi:hypothetical protein